MKLHWKVLLWMVAGAVVGVALQLLCDAPAWTGARWQAADGGIRAAAVRGPAAAANVDSGQIFRAAILDKGRPEERRYELDEPADLEALNEAGELVGALTEAENGDLLWLEATDGSFRQVTLGIRPDSERAQWIAPLDFLAEIFMALLRMLIVPLILTSIVSGVTGVGQMKDLRRLGVKTFGYYMLTSVVAIVVGQVLVNLIRPGRDAVLGLAPVQTIERDASFIDVLKRMVPTNIFESLADNGAMLQVIFFALLFGVFISRSPDPHRRRMADLFESGFEVMLRLAQGVLLLLPYGVFCLIARVVAQTGISFMMTLAVFMGTVVLAIAIHCLVTLPLLLKLFGRISPIGWAKAMAPALMTAFSTSSSSLTLPVTLETVEKRGKVSNKVSSFTLPLGSTINMDGTALYECIGVIFLAQYYASTSGYVLSLGDQAMVVFMALAASVGAAGIPSAGLVMMLTILSALDLPLEGAALLLAVDRPLDMLRTVTNVWSDTCGAAIVARSEGEEGPLTAGLAGASE